MNPQQYLLRMNDGRQFTDYTPRGSVPLPAGNLPAHQAKNKLIAEADALISRDRMIAAQASGMPAGADAQIADVPGFEIDQLCDTRTCTFAAPAGPAQAATGTRSGAAKLT